MLKVMPRYQTDRPDISGWFLDYEGRFYHDLVSKIENGIVVEIGNWHGLSLSYVVEVCAQQNNKIYAVDKFHCTEFLKNFKNWPQNTVELITMSSAEASLKFDDASIDLVFIDANHEYNSVHADINAWMPKIKKEGIISGHDYCLAWPGVIKVVDSLLPNRKIQDRIWYCKLEGI